MIGSVRSAQASRIRKACPASRAALAGMIAAVAAWPALSAAAVDTFGSGNALPTLAAGAIPAYDAAYQHMRGYWNSRLSVIPRLTLPNVPLPLAINLADPGDALVNAYKAAFVYTRIVQSGEAPFSGANNYDWLLNHDVPGILANRFALGDFADARNLLLDGRISEDPNFDEKGANWYWDGGALSGILGDPSQTDNLYGGGLRLPASWSVQYWNGSAFVDVPSPGAYRSGQHVQPRLVRLHHHDEAPPGDAKRARLSGCHPVGRPEHPRN